MATDTIADYHVLVTSLNPATQWALVAVEPGAASRYTLGVPATGTKHPGLTHPVVRCISHSERHR